MPRLAERHAHQPYFGDRWSPFAIARHYIGRLAHHVVSAEQLVADARGLSGNIFESYNVRMVDRPEPAPARLLDAHVSFPGILGRMFGKDDPRKDEVAEAMLRFDDTSERTALAGFVNVYANCKPVVHAEVQLLEHFYRGGLRFVEGDRYIACSKPACFCCKLYFEHHPAGMVVPQSHQNVWVNWAPPRVDNFQKGDAASDEQRDVMNEMIKVLRRDVVRQVLRISQLPGWHPDSVSGIGGL